VRTRATIKSARKGAKGGKNGQKRRPRRIAIMASNNNRSEEADSSDEGFVAIVECYFKWQTQPFEDHFEKLLDATYMHQAYPMKHKLKDCTMLKKFMMSGAPSSGSKLGRDPRVKSAAPIPREAEVMTIFD
jgi:hypothetical protein